MVCDNVSDAHTVAPATLVFTPDEIAEISRIWRNAQSSERDLGEVLERSRLPGALVGGMALRLTALKCLSGGLIEER